MSLALFFYFFAQQNPEQVHLGKRKKREAAIETDQRSPRVIGLFSMHLKLQLKSLEFFPSRVLVLFSNPIVKEPLGERIKY